VGSETRGALTPFFVMTLEPEVSGCFGVQNQPRNPPDPGFVRSGASQTTPKPSGLGLRLCLGSFLRMLPLPLTNAPLDATGNSESRGSLLSEAQCTLQGLGSGLAAAGRVRGCYILGLASCQAWDSSSCRALGCAIILPAKSTSQAQETSASLACEKSVERSKDPTSSLPREAQGAPQGRVGEGFEKKRCVEHISCSWSSAAKPLLPVVGHVAAVSRNAPAHSKYGAQTHALALKQCMGELKADGSTLERAGGLRR
jgi:hypothetical protein